MAISIIIYLLFNHYQVRFTAFPDLFNCVVLGSHTGENIRCELEAFMAADNIQDKLVRIVTDNASNNIKAFADLVVPGFEVYFEPEDDDEEASEEDEAQPGQQTEEFSIDEQEERLRIPCFAHTLQLTVGDGLKDCTCLKSAIAKIASIAKLR